MLTGQRAYRTAVATSAGRVLAVPVAQLRDVMAHEPGLSDLILRTFLLRRRPQRLGQACRRRHRRRLMAVRLVFDRLKSTGSTNAIELGPPA
jgi:CRP-like cAMP-binding protein